MSNDVNICLTCYVEFKSYKSDNRKYCCRRCFERRRIQSPCKGCGNKFYIPGEVGRTYCSKECYYKFGNIGTFEIGHKINKGREHSPDTISKISNSHRINRSLLIKGTIQFPNFNKDACNIIEKYGLDNGYNFQHALNGGEYHVKELGYWVDGYDKEKNVVVEYYEKFHSTPKHKIKDKVRMENIINALKCKFIIIYYNQKIEIWE
jgi:hypothetical protein